MRFLHLLFGHTPNAGLAGLALVVAVGLAWVCAVVAASLTRRLLTRAMSTGGQAPLATIRVPVRVVRALVWMLLTLVFLPPALELVGEPLRTGLRLHTLVEWTLAGGLRVLLILVLAFVVTRAVAIATGRFERSLGEAAGHSQVERAKRARTLSHLVRSTATIFVVAVATLEVLNELGVNLAPILTGAGILGLAVGFGAQTLVKDVIGGFFLILENHVRVGDVAEINGTGGLVEAINLRTIVLRDVRGAVHVFPCGAVATLTNLTKDFSFAVIDLRVDYQYDTDRVVALLARVSADLAKDPAFSKLILDGLEVLGIEQLGDQTVTIRARLKTVPQKQWDVARELRRRIKKTCEAEGIQLSLPPQRVEMTRPTQSR